MKQNHINQSRLPLLSFWWDERQNLRNPFSDYSILTLWLLRPWHTRYCKIHTEIWPDMCKMWSCAFIVLPCHCCSPTHHPQSQWEAVCNTDLWKTIWTVVILRQGNVLHPITQLLHWDCKPVSVYSLQLWKQGAHEADLMMQVKNIHQSRISAFC